jgi:hypothetical protein
MFLGRNRNCGKAYHCHQHKSPPILKTLPFSIFNTSYIFKFALFIVLFSTGCQAIGCSSKTIELGFFEIWFFINAYFYGALPK